MRRCTSWLLLFLQLLSFTGQRSSHWESTSPNLWLLLLSIWQAGWKPRPTSLGMASVRYKEGDLLFGWFLPGGACPPWVTVLALRRGCLADVSQEAGSKAHLWVRAPGPRTAQPRRGEQEGRGPCRWQEAGDSPSRLDSSSCLPPSSGRASPASALAAPQVARAGTDAQRIRAQVLLRRVPSGEGRPDAQGDITSLNLRCILHIILTAFREKKSETLPH